MCHRSVSAGSFQNPGKFCQTVICLIIRTDRNSQSGDFRSRSDAGVGKPHETDENLPGLQLRIDFLVRSIRVRGPDKICLTVNNIEAQ